MTVEGVNKGRKYYGGKYAGMAVKIFHEGVSFAGMAGLYYIMQIISSAPTIRSIKSLSCMNGC